MSLLIYSDEYYMNKAYQLALQAYHEDEVPIGALIVSGNTIIAKAYNQVEKLQDVSAHAEFMAITSACEYLGSKYLTNCSIYVTLEPCAMCCGLIHWAQLAKVVFGAFDPNKGFSKYNPPLLLPKTEIIGGILADDCTQLINTFFKEKRE